MSGHDQVWEERLIGRVREFSGLLICCQLLIQELLQTEQLTEILAVQPPVVIENLIETCTTCCGGPEGALGDLVGRNVAALKWVEARHTRLLDQPHCPWAVRVDKV
ncbi:hypothetical protein E4N62_24700 [Streptomyces sp. MNU76]|uniref:hypothetical protein n=1 Tax=Streptomyces sp. MNU76 TaxID=2560026 RepID=UPI001E2D4137|nr:hypothetical protein [Streptomyces sp. MNU76]MCC9708173.1 hypothetical protein [Streptomyces sp. MNU76]